MRIGIDISQIVYEGTGVARHVRNTVRELLRQDKENEYILFGASLRQLKKIQQYCDSLRFPHPKLTVKLIPIPPTLLHILWNVLHIMPVEWFIGKIDIFWSSDWIQPPLLKAKGVTTIHDISFLRYPQSFPKTILTVQKKRLEHAFSECKLFFCDSEATKKDIVKYYQIEPNRLKVIYPGYS